jgi:hypothetical protein
MKTAFAEGTISEYWENSIEPEKWFDPAFEHLINNEIMKHEKGGRKDRMNPEELTNPVVRAMVIAMRDGPEGVLWRVRQLGGADG